MKILFAGRQHNHVTHSHPAPHHVPYSLSNLENRGEALEKNGQFSTFSTPPTLIPAPPKCLSHFAWFTVVLRSPVACGNTFGEVQATFHLPKILKLVNFARKTS